MNCSQFKDHVSNMCLAGTVVACWSLTYEMTSSSPFTVMPNIFVTEFAQFSETFRKKSSRSRSQAPQMLVCKYVDEDARLSCWPLRGQQVSHQR